MQLHGTWEWKFFTSSNKAKHHCLPLRFTITRYLGFAKSSRIFRLSPSIFVCQGLCLNRTHTWKIIFSIHPTYRTSAVRPSRQTSQALVVNLHTIYSIGFIFHLPLSFAKIHAYIEPRNDSTKSSFKVECYHLSLRFTIT